jgi:glycosyltransferase involved in cell wall biosynthesis
MFSSTFSLKPLWILKSTGFGGKIILAPRGMLNQSALAGKKWKKKIFLNLFTWTRFHDRLFFHATDEQEKNDIMRHFNGTSSVTIAQNIPNAATQWKQRKKEKGELRIVYVSRVHPIKNLLFAIRLMKVVKASCKVNFDIYGTTEDQEYYERCMAAIKENELESRVRFMGPVLHSHLFETLEQYHLFFLPTKGENFGHAIFEALSAGCPVLISNRTPWMQLTESNAGWALPLNNSEAFVDKLDMLCDMNETEFNRFSKAAHDYANAYVDSMDYEKKYFTLFEADK